MNTRFFDRFSPIGFAKELQLLRPKQIVALGGQLDGQV